MADLFPREEIKFEAVEPRPAYRKATIDINLLVLPKVVIQKTEEDRVTIILVLPYAEIRFVEFADWLGMDKEAVLLSVQKELAMRLEDNERVERLMELVNRALNMLAKKKERFVD